MYRIKRIMLLVLFFSLICRILCGCTFAEELQSFSVEDLECYEAPIIFLGSDNDRYFIILDDPDKKYNLNFEQIWDSDSVDRKFLFSMETDGKTAIYEYDLGREEAKCLIEEDSVCHYLNLSQDLEFESVYYYVYEGTISFLYGDYLLIYDFYKNEFIDSIPLVLGLCEEVYGWLNSQIFLMEADSIGEFYKFNIMTGEKIKVGENLGLSLVLTEDKTMGCSYGDENWFGVSFSPVLIWDTQNYEVKRLHEGVASMARTQLSDDKKYVMFARINSNEPNQVLCIKVEEESLCEVYTTQEYIYDILW